MLNERIEENIVIAELENGKTNSITKETLEKLQAIVKKVNTDDSLKGIIITGAGRFFSSGFDLPMFLGFKDLDEVVSFFQFEEHVLIDLFTCQKPVIAAMNGHTTAGGLITAMAADYRIVKNHPKIKIGMSEIKIGLGLSLAQAEIMKFGLDSDKKFRDVMYFGQMFDVTRAKEMEIVDELVETDEELINRAKQVISSWVDNPGTAFKDLKRVLRAPAAKNLQNMLETIDWKSPLNCFFDKSVRGTLEMVQKMMG